MRNFLYDLQETLGQSDMLNIVNSVIDKMETKETAKFNRSQTSYMSQKSSGGGSGNRAGRNLPQRERKFEKRVSYICMEPYSLEACNIAALLS